MDFRCATDVDVRFQMEVMDERVAPCGRDGVVAVEFGAAVEKALLDTAAGGGHPAAAVADVRAAVDENPSWNVHGRLEGADFRVVRRRVFDEDTPEVLTAVFKVEDGSLLFSRKYLPHRMFERMIRRDLQDEIESGLVIRRPFEFNRQRGGILAFHVLLEAEPIDEFLVVGPKLFKGTVADEILLDIRQYGNGLAVCRGLKLNHDSY